DVAAVAVGRDPVFGSEPLAHGLDGGAAPVLALGIAAAGGFSRSRRFPVAMSRSGPSQVRLSSEQYPASASTSPIPLLPGASPASRPLAGRCAPIRAAACCARAVIGANQAMSVVSPVSSVAMTRP